MDMEKLQPLDNLPLTEAQETATSLIDRRKTRKVVAMGLERDIQKARSSAEVSRIMWQVYLSGNGLGTVGSQWKSFYKGV